MKKSLNNIIYIFKGIIAILIIVVLVLTFSIHKNSKANIEEVWEKMTASLDFEQVPEMDNQGIRRFLGLNPDDYAGIYYCKSADPMQASEIVLVKFKDDEDADSFLSKMESHRDERTNLFAGYAPDEEQLLKNSILEAEANFAVFLVNQDAQTMYEIFKEEIAR